MSSPVSALSNIGVVPSSSVENSTIVAIFLIVPCSSPRGCE